MKKVFFLFFFIHSFGATVASTNTPALLSLVANRGLEQEVSRRAIDFFLQNTDARTGLVRERAMNFMPTPDTPLFRRSSLAGVGFGLAVVANAAMRGFIPDVLARAYIFNALHFLDLHYASITRRGWFRHYVDWETGLPSEPSEFSTVDTAWFLAGALYAAQLYPGTRIARIAHSFFRRVDFGDMLTDGGAQPGKKTLSMAYLPKTGFPASQSGYTGAQWNQYAEQSLLLILGMGSPTHPLPPEIWSSWRRESIQLPNGQELMGYNRPLFIHQYPQLFLDFRGFNDGYGNYFANSVAATIYNRDACVRSPSKTFLSGFWGLSAGDVPGNDPDVPGYEVDSPSSHKDTACVGCVLGSAMFLPDMIWSDVNAWITGPFHNQIWGNYGITDSVDLDEGWFSPQVHSLTVAAAYLSIANQRNETSVWKDFMKLSAIRRGLARAASLGP